MNVNAIATMIVAAKMYLRLICSLLEFGLCSVVRVAEPSISKNLPEVRR